MKLLLSSLQLASLCALSSWSVSSQSVTQSEDVTIKEGDTAQITCCWKSEQERVRVTWLKNQTVIKHDLLNRTSESVVQSNCSLLTIANITKEHSGTYFCKVLVEIPYLEQETGQGTVITVISKNETEEQKGHGDNNLSHTSFYILIGLAVAAPILLITLIYFCCLRRKQDQAARVIYEVPHFDSESQDMDKNSTGSRGSSQWCQVPVYESFDYFEHVEAKKSG